MKNGSDFSGKVEKSVRKRSTAAYLKAIDIFQDLDAEEIEEIHRFFPMRECSSGTVFFHGGERDEYLYILKEGRVALYRLTEDGRRLVVGMVYPGTIFGEMMMAGLGMRDCFAEAQEETLVCRATRTDFEILLHRKPAVGFRLLEVFGRRILALEEQLEQIAYRDVPGRIADFLLHRADPESRTLGGYTQADIADAIGAARQTVTIELKRYERAGAIEVHRRRIILKDPQQLKLRSKSPAR